MGDFERAFPKTWRENPANLVYSTSGLRGRAFISLCSAFAWDEVAFFSSGVSSVCLNQGLPEGGTLGTTTYTTLPDSFIKRLEAKGHVYGINKQVPPVWAAHTWRGFGSPSEELVLRLLHDLSSGNVLPSEESLSTWPNLEASALKAMDLLAT